MYADKADPLCKRNPRECGKRLAAAAISDVQRELGVSRRQGAKIALSEGLGDWEWPHAPAKQVAICKASVLKCLKARARGEEP